MTLVERAFGDEAGTDGENSYNKSRQQVLLSMYGTDFRSSGIASVLRPMRIVFNDGLFLISHVLKSKKDSLPIFSVLNSSQSFNTKRESSADLHSYFLREKLLLPIET